MNPETQTLEDQLKAPDPAARAAALAALRDRAAAGEIALPPAAEVANMHCHTTYSYNGYGLTPTALAWLAKRRGYKLMGIVDFDVLDGVDEWFAAADRLALRATAGMETRAYLDQFADREINSPGEPGVTYHMGIGFTAGRVPEDQPAAQRILADMRARAAERNRALIARVNAHLDPVALDYDRDVLPLTPAGNATERHICRAYAVAAAATVPDPAAFWAAKLDLPLDQVRAAITDAPALDNLIRAKLMKRGGVGYVRPGPATFPSVADVNTLITACGALPTITWLDGTTAGEQAAEELFHLMIAKGAVALNIVPDRNWNIPDPAVKAVKLQNLYDVVALAEELALPLNIGTEMNAPGQPLIDDFAAPELAPVRDAFLDGAYFVYGHTALHRALGLGYQSDWARAHFPTRRARNAFYTQMGRRIPPGPAALTALRQLSPSPDPHDLLSAPALQ
jgi:hypothetical protein